MKFKSSLRLIVALLALPSIILAWLWLSEAYHDLNRHKSASQGLLAAGKVWPQFIKLAMMPRTGDDQTITEVTTAINLMIENNELGLDPGSVERLQAAIAKESSEAKLAGIGNAIREIGAASKMSSVLIAEQKILADLLTEFLPPMVQRSRSARNMAENFAQKNELNGWDRMAFSVGAGQFKVIADRASSPRNLEPLLAKMPMPMLEASLQALRRANNQFQGQAGKIAINHARDLDARTSRAKAVALAADLDAALTVILDGADQYWRAIQAQLTMIVDQDETAIIQKLAITGLACTILMVAAFALALSLGRALEARTERAMVQRSLYDPLTNLPNRKALKLELVGLIEQKPYEGLMTALICLDLMSFKTINNRFGEQAGDQILRNLAQELEHATEYEHFLARIGGNQFAVICRIPASAGKYHPQHHLNKTARQMTKVVQRPQDWGGEAIRLSAAVGTAIFDEGTADTEQLLQNAEMALRAAKSAPKSKFLPFSFNMRADFDADQRLADAIRQALDQGRIVPWFQPQVSLPDRRIVGFEALVRWEDPEFGIRSPAQFLAAAARADLVPMIELEVRRQAFRAMRSWLDAGLSIDHVGINVSADQLGDPAFIEQLFAELAGHDLGPSHAAIEILESVMIEGAAANQIRENVGLLSRAGCYLELDDFGTGHTGLSSLRQLNVNRVKIDRSFIVNVHENKELQKLTRALIELAAILDIDVLAEGVELHEECAWLLQNRCPLIQGYLIAKPMCFADTIPWARHFLAQGTGQDGHMPAGF